MKVSICNSEMDMGGPYLTELRDSNDIMHDMDALRERMREDGYILIRGLHDRDKVLRARAEILDRLHRMGKLDPDFPIHEGVIREGGKGVMFGGTNLDLPAYLDVVNAPELMDFFSRFLNGPALTYDYKWLRAIDSGGFTGVHYDVVYMGRGTKQLYTLWTPFGDTPVEMGTLAVLLGSHKLERLKATYGKMDVDRDPVDGGWISRDPLEIVEKFGGKWAIADFRAGDAIFFGMYTMHASTANRTNRYRVSCDTRYQLASEPVDDRWIGPKPRAHSERAAVPRISIDEARKQWGLD